jgi:hypothetical protein
MKKCIPVCLLASLLAFPQTVASQELGIGARIGTLGFGAEAAVSFNENIAARGGLGSFIIDFDAEYADIEYTVTPPSLTGTLGVDIYPTGGSFRIMGGLMFRSADIRLESEKLEPGEVIEIGDVEFDQGGWVSGELDTKSTAPFLGIGFGRHTAGGFGVTFDLGVAFVGEPDVILTPQGALASAPNINQEIDTEIAEFEEDIGDILQYWPILSFGLKIPLNIGGR